MNREHFNNYLQHPETMDQRVVNEFKELTIRYPFCSTIHILFAIGLFNENDLDFNLQLKRAAACIVSRKKLKALFSEPVNIQRSDEVKHVHQFNQAEIPETRIDEHLVPDLEQPSTEILQVENEDSKSRLELLEIVHSRLAEIKAASDVSGDPEPVIIPDENAVTYEEPALSDHVVNRVEGSSNAGTDKQLLSKEEILARFIRDEPRISTPKSTFFSPQEIAAKSNVDEEDIVSETLAQLFYDQGNLAKAVKIYEKLSLLFPEKSRYFADQILKINTK